MTEDSSHVTEDSSHAAWLQQARSYLRSADPVRAPPIDDRPDFDPRASPSPGVAGEPESNFAAENVVPLVYKPAMKPDDHQHAQGELSQPHHDCLASDEQRCHRPARALLDGSRRIPQGRRPELDQSPDVLT